MGAQTLFAQLNRRVLSLLVPALLAVAVASIALTDRALSEADIETARARAMTAAHELHVEVTEKDPPAVALKESLEGIEREHLSATLRVGPYIGRSTSPAPFELDSLAPGSCARTKDGRWQACAAAEGDETAVVAISTARHRSVIAILTRSMLAVSALAIVLVVAGLRRSLRAATESLRALSRWSELIDGAPGSAVPTERPTIREHAAIEVTQLANAFEQLVHRLLEALARERANAAFIAHEMRTPLAAMRADLETAPPSELGTRLSSDVDRLGQVIDAVMLLSTPTTQRRARDFVNLSDLVRELAPAETTVIAPDEALIEGDAALLTLALRNLIENCAKHAGKPPLRIEITRSDALASIAVVDDGPGLTEAQIAHVFSRFWRGDSGAEGSGLGLALVSAVAERHGGSASAEQANAAGGISVTMRVGPVVRWA